MTRPCRCETVAASALTGRLVRVRGIVEMRRAPGMEIATAAVIERLDEAASGEPMDYPQEYGPVATSSQVFPDLPMGAPPIGSEEFEQFIDELVRSEQRPSETADSGADSDDPTPSNDGSIQ